MPHDCDKNLQSLSIISSHGLSEEDSILMMKLRLQITQNNNFLSKYEFICLALQYIGLSPKFIGFREAALCVGCILLVYPENSFPNITTKVYPIVAALENKHLNNTNNIGKNIDDSISHAWKTSKQMRLTFYKRPSTKRFLKYFVNEICLGGKVSKIPSRN